MKGRGEDEEKEGGKEEGDRRKKNVFLLYSCCNEWFVDLELQTGMGAEGT